jgi:hypothetical protein
MDDLARELILGAASFAEARLRSYLTGKASTSDALADAFGVPHAAAAGAAVTTHLNGARTSLDNAKASLAARDPQGAAQNLSGSVTELEAAINAVAWPAVNPGLAGALDQIRAAGGVASGLAKQLGLTVMPATPDGLKVEDGSLVFAVDSLGNVTLSSSPVSVSLGPRTLRARLRLTNPGVPLFSVSLDIKQARVGVGFDLAAVLLGSGSAVQADLTIGADTDHGLLLGGTTSTSINLPASPASGVLDVTGLRMELPPAPASTVNLGAILAAHLGPADLSVDGIGVALQIDPASLATSLSSLSIAPLPPTGVGISLDAGFASGGGYLGRRGNQFGGVLDLRMGPIGLTGIGLLSTGGDTGFAIAVIMSIEFTPAIDLTFGFTLNAVGGMIGIQHVIDTDAINAAMHDHSIDYLLFPDDPAAHASAIIDSLVQDFPLRRGGFVVGPMIKLGWGRPISFVTASLGVVLSLPDPKVVILGQLRVNLPAPDFAVIDLKADAFAEFSAERFLMRVALVDSRIAAFSIDGDFGILIRFGDSPDLAFSAGGFHPSYTPPKELAGMHRVSVDVSPPSILRLRADAYFALTTNSVQAGAHVELSADLDIVSANGYLEFDAIIHIAPSFSFSIDIGAGVSIRFEGHSIAGIDLHLHLEGPAPWKAHGSGTFTFLGFDKDFDVPSLQWGPDAPQPPDFVHPRDEIAAALSDVSAWQAQLPAGSDRLVQLREDPAETASLVHPAGLFEVRQHVAPLETVLARIGPNPVPASEKRVHLELPTVNGVPVDAMSGVTDLFASGQYLDLTDDQRLSRPAFEPMLSGLHIDPGANGTFDVNLACQSDLEYETFVADDDSLMGVYARQLADWLSAGQSMVLAAGAAGRSSLRSSSRYSAGSEPIALADAGQVMARSTESLAPVPAVTAAPVTYTHAAEALRGAVLGGSVASDAVQLVRVGVGS